MYTTPPIASATAASDSPVRQAERRVPGDDADMAGATRSAALVRAEVTFATAASGGAGTIAGCSTACSIGCSTGSKIVASSPVGTSSIKADGGIGRDSAAPAGTSSVGTADRGERRRRAGLRGNRLASQLQQDGADRPLGCPQCGQGTRCE